MNTPERPEHRMERRYDLPATAEEVWQVIATGDGISSWFVPTRLDPRVGGEVSFDLGAATSTGTVTGYDPQRRFAYEEPWPLPTLPEDVPAGMARWFASIGVPLEEVYATLPDVSPIATEYLVEAASGGTCVVRVVTSAYGTGADWETEFFDQMAESLTPMIDRLTTAFSASARS